MKKMQMKYVCLLLAWLSVPLQVTDATASRMKTPDVYQLLESGNSELVRSLHSGEREIFLATMAMNQGKTKQALVFLNATAVRGNRLAALIKAEAYRQQSVQAANRAGHYAHAVNDDISTLKRARITRGLDEANKRLTAFMARVNRAKPSSLHPVADKPIVAVLVRSVSAPVLAKVAPANIASVKPAKLKPTVLLEPVTERVVKLSELGLSSSVLETIETWRKDWESRDNDSYLSHYHKAFRTLKYDYNSWVAYKRRVNGNKTFIKVSLSNITVIPSPDRAQEGEAVLVIFNQRYQSSNFNAVSRKQLYMARRNSSEPWLILYEGDGS